jgi:uncharacterized protein YbjQ (UPF0145 family)
VGASSVENSTLPGGTTSGDTASAFVTGAPGQLLAGAAHQEADLAELGRALASAQSAKSLGAGGATSDLTLDEVLLLHSAGLEPAQVAFGVGSVSISQGVWVWSTGEVVDARQAFHQALDEAKEGVRASTRSAGGIGVVGVDVELQLSSHRFTVVVTGTAVRPFADDSGRRHFNVNYRVPFICDLSARDFAVLSSAGWYPLDLVAGACYVHAPRRNTGTAIGQAAQNVELENYTQTLYQAREAAMEQLQSQLAQAGGTGLVDAKIVDRPLHFANHIVEFVVYGTAIKMLAERHSHPKVALVMPLDDAVRTFEATSLRE